MGAAAAIGLVGCADEPAPTRADVEAVLRDRVGLTDDQAACAARKLVRRFDDAGIRSLVVPDGFSHDRADQAVVVEVMIACSFGAER